MNEDRRIDRLRGGLLGAALLLAPACQVVAPDDGEFHFHSRTYAMGKYVRHGFIVNDEPVLQEKADVGWGPWTLKTHLNYDTEKRILDQRFAGLEFGTDLGEDWSLRLLYAYLDFNGFEELGKTQEVVGVLTYEWEVVTSLFYLHDWDTGKGNLYELSGRRTFPFDGWSLTPSVVVSYNDEYFTADSDFAHVESMLTGTVPLADHVNLSAFAAFSDALNDGLGNSRLQDVWWGGLILSVRY